KVVDFDAAAIVKQCADPPGPIGGRVDQWLLESPSEGPTFHEEVVGGDPGNPALRGMILDPSVPCEKSFVDIDASEARFYSGSGEEGIEQTGGWESMRANADTEGRLSVS